MTDWLAWVDRYADPSSAHARRLPVVRRLIGQSLDQLGDDPRSVLSLCAGDGRDVLPELARRRERSPRCVLVEQDARLAGRATAEAETLGLGPVAVCVGDAAAIETYADALPVDLLVVCGVFGNVSADDIRRTVFAVPAMLTAGGFVVWTRGRCDGPDLRSTVRRWFAEAGLTEIEFESELTGYGVGLHRATAATRHDVPLPDRLFTFFS